MKYAIIVLLLIHCYGNSFAQGQAQPVRISGKANFLNDGDTVRLILYPYGLISTEPTFCAEYKARVSRHAFSFTIPGQPHSQTFSLSFDYHQYDLVYYKIETGSQVRIVIDKGRPIFSGPGSAGLQLQYGLKQIEAKFFIKNHLPEFQPETIMKYFGFFDEVKQLKMTYLDQHRKAADPVTVGHLKADVLGDNTWSKYSRFNYWARPGDIAYADSLWRGLQQYLRNTGGTPQDLSQTDWYSNSCATAVLEHYEAEFYLTKKFLCPVENCLRYVIDHYSGTAREQLAVSLLVNNRKFPAALRPLTEDLLPEVRTPAYRQFLANLLASRVEGAAAYDFALQDTAGRIVRLSDLKGQVVVIDFWFTGCENCRELSPFMREAEEKFKDQGVKFVSICTDKRRSQWLNSVRSGAYVSSGILNLSTGEEGLKSRVMSRYRVSDFPTLIVVTRSGGIQDVAVDPRDDQGKSLAAQIRRAL